MAPSKGNFSLLWHSFIVSQQKASSFGNDTRKTWWISGKGCNQVTLDSILQIAFGFAVQLIHMVDSCSPLGRVWQVEHMSGDKSGQEKQSGAGCGWVHAYCMRGQLAHTRPFRLSHASLARDGCFLFAFSFSPGWGRGEKGSSRPPMPTQFSVELWQRSKHPGDRELFPQKYTLLTI